MVLCGFSVITWGQKEHGFGAPGALRGQSLHPCLGKVSWRNWTPCTCLKMSYDASENAAAAAPEVSLIL